jgi:ankyrin repeat protein
VEALLEFKANPNLTDKDGQTALLIAVIYKNQRIIRALLDAGADPSIADHDNQTPLSWAAILDNNRPTISTLGIMRTLVRAGARHTTVHGLTPCNAVARLASRGDTETMCHLLRCGAPITAQGSFRSPLYEAAEAGQIATALALLGAGARVDEFHPYYGTPLHGAALGGHAEAVRELLKAGADVHIKRNGETPLASAAGKGNVAVVRALAAAGADIDTKNEEGQTPVWIAARDCRTDMVRVLADLGADLNAVDMKWWTPLQATLYTSMGTKTETARALLEAGADPEAFFSCGRMPIAAAASDPYKIRLLWTLAREYGADPRGRGQRAFARAQQNGLAFAMLRLSDNRGLPDDILRKILLPWTMPETAHAIATRTGNRDGAALLAWLAELHDEPPEHAAANAAACKGLCRWCQKPMRAPVALVPCGHCACPECAHAARGDVYGPCFACGTAVLLRVPAKTFPPQRALI